MTEEQRKWYLAGANDMEAGRLVTEPVSVEQSVRAAVGSEVERYKVAESEASDAKEAVEAENEKLRASALTAEEERDKMEEYAKEGWDWLSEALDALGAKTVFDIKARAASMDRARKLAEESAVDWEQWPSAAKRFGEIARLLGGDDESTTKGDT